MHPLHAVILGIVEGLTEYLPISSTGHLIVASKLLGLPDSEFLKTFEIAIQSGAILAVVVLFWKRLTSDLPTLKRVAVAFLPTAVIGLAVHGIVKRYLLGDVNVVIASLLVGGIVLIAFERLHKVRPDAIADPSRISYKTAAVVGVCQSVAIVPGVSRSGATVVGGLALGMTRPAIVEFSFLLAVPTMIAATGLDLLKSAHSFSGQEYGLLAIGFASAFVAGLAGVRFLLRFVSTRSFEAFGWYRIAAAVAFWLLLK